MPQDRYPKAILTPIRGLMTSPSEKSPWRTSRLLDPLRTHASAFLTMASFWAPWPQTMPARVVTILLGWLMPPGSVEILATLLLVIMELAGLRSAGDARECARAELHRQI